MATLGSQTQEKDEKQWSVYIGESKLERPVRARPQAVKIYWWGMTAGQQRSHGGTIRGPAGGGLPGPSKASSVRGWIGMLNQIKGGRAQAKQGGWATSEKGNTGTGGKHNTFRGAATNQASSGKLCKAKGRAQRESERASLIQFKGVCWGEALVIWSEMPMQISCKVTPWRRADVEAGQHRGRQYEKMGQA
ncbi:unnamed protein product [Calypogeia fissa]